MRAPFRSNSKKSIIFIFVHENLKDVVEFRETIKPSHAVEQENPPSVSENIQQVQALRIHVPNVLTTVILLGDCLEQLAAEMALVVFRLGLHPSFILITQLTKVDA